MHLCLSQQNARRLTLQSRGRHPASRAPPLISNVSRLVSECVASVPCLGRCACVHRRMKSIRWAVSLLHPIGSAGAGCPSAGGQRTGVLHRASLACLQPRLVVGLEPFIQRHRRSCQTGPFTPRMHGTLRFPVFDKAGFVAACLSAAVPRAARA